MQRFRDRREAGRRLAELLGDYRNNDDVVVLGLPRGGVPVAYEIAMALNAPLDVYIVRKLGTPRQEELAMGAIASDGARVINDEIVHTLNIPQSEIDRVAEQEREELKRRDQKFRGRRERIPLENKVVILVDDGLATGASMKAAVQAIQTSSPQKVIVAVGTAPEETLEEFRQLDGVDDALAAIVPRVFYGVGGSYQDFTQTSDDQVVACLEKARERRS